MKTENDEITKDIENNMILITKKNEQSW